MRAATPLLALFFTIGGVVWGPWRGVHSTCVFDSDFGFTLNCQFRKSSMFRVRNLGGVKGYVGVGFSVGDELGFKQSLSNVEGNKRREAVGRSTGLSPVSSEDAARQYLGQSTHLTTVPPFRPIPPAQPLVPVIAIQTNDTVRRYAVSTVPKAYASMIPQFQAMPLSITQAKAPQAFRNALQQATDNFQSQSSKLSHRAPLYSHQGPQVLQVVAASERISDPSKPLPTAIPVPNALPGSVKKTTPAPALATAPALMSDTVKALSAASNISEDAIIAAIALKQQQLLQQQKPKTTSTTAKPVVATEPPRKYPLASPSKVMNAPKEYYPVGYDKNFDDNFVSRVELPDTAFYCGEQKHFPGLYADEDLGCMVFHVCAFTDDGLIMKSFLCPESTLFDQSILKCNWWFYVDCKASKKLYDSNIPVSKSYQLMKALSFFSAYNKQR